MEARAAFEELFGEVADLLQNNKTDDAIIVIKTAAGNIYHRLIRCIGVVRHDGFPKETANSEAVASDFLTMLREKNDTHVQYILTALNGNILRVMDNKKCSVEMPPFCIRKGLIELDERNADAIILIDGLHNIRICESMPPQKQM